MRSRFLQYLIERAILPPDDAATLGAEAASFREVVGAIALSHNLIDMEQLDHILACLGKEKRFGEAALELGYLTEAQLQALLAIQEMQEAVEVGEALIVRDIMPRAAVLAELGRFFSQVDAPGAQAHVAAAPVSRN